MGFCLILLFIAALLCNSCTPTDQPPYEVQKKSITEAHHGHIKLVNLNADELLLIFSHLEIMDLLQLTACSNGKIIALAQYSYWIRYKDCEVEILDRFDGIRYLNESMRIKVSEKESTRMLRYFGISFQQLFLTEPSNEIMRYVNEYARSTLTKLSVDYATEDTLKLFTKPFNDVIDVTLQFRTLEKIESDPLPLTLEKVFPNVQRLRVEIDRDIGFDYLFRKFQSLEHFDFSHGFKFGFIDVGEFFKINTHIESVELGYLPQRLCDILQEYLPNLKSLALSKHRFEIERNTTIDSVKHFQITNSQFDFQAGSMIRLSFPNLQSIQFGFTGYIDETWSEFLRKHSNTINRLRIMNVFSSQHDQLLVRVLDEILNLKEITLQYSLSSAVAVAPGTIQQIIEKHKRLEKMELIGFRLNEDEANDLRNEFENDWNISAHYYERNDRNIVDMLFVKKN